MIDSPGKRLALFRKNVGATQRDLAAALGFSPGRIGSIESGAAVPSREFLNRISERYRVSSDWLLYGRGEMQHEPEPGFQPANPNAPRIEPPDRTRPMGSDFRSGDQAFSIIRRYDVAGPEVPKPIVQSESTEGQVAFTRSWLLERGISADTCGLVPAKGLASNMMIPDWATMLVSFAVKHPLKQGFHLYKWAGELRVDDFDSPEYDDAMRMTKVLISHRDLRNNRKTVEPSGEAPLVVLGRVVSIISDVSF